MEEGFWEVDDLLRGGGCLRKRRFFFFYEGVWDWHRRVGVLFGGSLFFWDFLGRFGVGFISMEFWREGFFLDIWYVIVIIMHVR